MENLLTVSLRALSHHVFFHGVSFISTRLKNGYYSPDENNKKEVERQTVKAKQEQKRYYRCCSVYL